MNLYFYHDKLKLADQQVSISITKVCLKYERRLFNKKKFMISYHFDITKI